MVELAGAACLEGADPQELRDICALPMTMGDDAMDVALGAYNIAMNLDLLACADVEPVTDEPAIVVGSGPSLDGWLDKLRQTYGQYVLVAAPSACPVLVKNGTPPHVVAAKERVRQPAFCFEGLDTQTAMLAGLAVVPDLHRQFAHAWCVGNADPLAVWSMHSAQVATGPTSGTHAVTVAKRLTTGPVCLVGMDNCGKHYAGYPLDDPDGGDPVVCYDGEQRASQWVYRVARANLGRQAEGRLVQLCDTAAVIPGIPLSCLPPGGPFTIPAPKRSHSDRKEAFRSVLKRLPEDWDAFFGYTQTVATLADTALMQIRAENRELFLTMLSPTMAQLSMERRLGMSDADVLQWYREATRNMHEMLTPTIWAMAHAAGIYHG